MRDPQYENLFMRGVKPDRRKRRALYEKAPRQVVKCARLSYERATGRSEAPNLARWRVIINLRSAEKRAKVIRLVGSGNFRAFS